MLEVAGGVRAESCFDSATSSVRLTLKIETANKVWAAVGFRQTDECLMTPRGGGNGEVVFAQPDAQGAYKTYFGPLSPSMKQLKGDSPSSFIAGLSPIGEVAEFKANMIDHSNGQLTLGFARSYASKPSALNLSFAFGSTAEVGYHSSRGCFALSNVPACPASACPRCPVCRFDLGGTGATHWSMPVTVSVTVAALLVIQTMFS